MTAILFFATAGLSADFTPSLQEAQSTLKDFNGLTQIYRDPVFTGWKTFEFNFVFIPKEREQEYQSDAQGFASTYNGALVMFMGAIDDETYSMKAFSGLAMNGGNDVVLATSDQKIVSKESYGALLKIKENFSVDIKNWLAKQSPAIRQQEKFDVAVAVFGSARDLYFKCNNIVKNAQKTEIKEAKIARVKDLNQRKSSIENYFKHFTKTVDVNIRGVIKKLNIKLLGLYHEKEALLEAKVFFGLDWESNKQALARIAESIDNNKDAFEMTGDAFRKPDGFVAVSIGTLFSHSMYMEDNEYKTYEYKFGTSSNLDDGFVQQQIQNMMKDFKHINRPILFINAISNANTTFITPGAYFIYMHRQTKFSFFDDRGRPNDASIMANVLKDELNKHQIKKAFIHKIKTKNDKLSYKWSKFLTTTLHEFNSDGYHFVGDISGRSFAVRAVRHKQFIDEKLNLVNLLPGTNRDQYSDQDAIYEYYEKINKSEVHSSLIRNVDTLILSITKYLESMNGNNEVRNQMVFNFVIGHTGKLMDLCERYDVEVKRLEDDAKMPPAKETPLKL